MDANLTQRRRGLEEKIPDIRKTLTMVEYLNERRVSEFVYFISDFSCLLTLRPYCGKKTDDLGADLENLDLEEGEASKKPLVTTFELNETLYAEAELEDTDVVYLWLGVPPPYPHPSVSMISLNEILSQANVMLSYKIPEAIELLATKLKNAEASLLSLQDDLEFLREQITVMEVNTARLYNWDVVRRRERRAKEAATSTG
jgi:hypothetical protein